MKALAVAATALAVLSGLAMFVCFTLAIWHPWGHSEEWGSTGAMLLFVTFLFGAGSAGLWIEATS